MSLFKDLISQIDRPSSSTPSAPSPAQRLTSGSPRPVPKPAPRTTVPSNNPSEPQALKRKASSTIENAQIKTQRKDGPAPARPTNGAVRNPAPSASVKPSPSISTTSMPYRGTAGLGASRPASVPVKKLSPVLATSNTVAPAPRPAVQRSSSASSSLVAPAPQKKTGGYMAMLMKAKEKEQTKPIAPPIKHEPTKILTKKERLEAKAAAKGKKPVVGATARPLTGKQDLGKDMRKPVSTGYQGTARPGAAVAPRKVVDVGYKGTARPASASGPAGRPGISAAKPKPKNYNGYARWSDEDEELEDEEEEDDYESESDMEGGIWDVEKEEKEALKAAKKEDAEAIAEEIALKRAKEERRKKLEAMNKAASGKKKSQY